MLEATPALALLGKQQTREEMKVGFFVRAMILSKDAEGINNFTSIK